MSCDLTHISLPKRGSSPDGEERSKPPEPGRFRKIMGQKVEQKDSPSSKKKSIFEAENPVLPATSHTPLSLLDTNPISPPSVASSISMETSEIMESLAEIISLEEGKGIATITATIQMRDPHSVFQHGEITLTHYDTAPHSFQIQFSGSFEGVKQFTSHQDTILQSLQVKFPGFDISFQPARIQDTSSKAAIKARIGSERKKRVTQATNSSSTDNE